MKERWTALLLLLLLAGLGLRVVRWSDWPPGPWIDEAYVLRAARIVAAEPGASLAGTSPLEPPDAGFVNHWPSNLYLRFASLLDRAAGGGLASFRLLSIGPSLLLLLLALLLACEASAGAPVFLGVAASGLATSSWLLGTGRWGWDVPATSAVTVASAWAALAASRSGSLPVAGLAGALLGLAQYGYAAARPLLALPPIVLAAAAATRRRGDARLAAAALTGTVLAAAPLAVHLLGHPERAVARAREVSLLARSPGEALAGVARNAVAYAELFLLRGDRNERHGDPTRPILPPLSTGLALAGAAVACRREGGLERLLLLAAGLVLVAGLTTAPEEGGNAYRIALAAPFLLVLAGHGASRLVALVPSRHERLALVLLGAGVAVTAATEVAGFVSWASGPRLRGAFGGPERELADATGRELSRRPAEVVLSPDVARNPYVVDALLASPRGGGRPVLALAPGLEGLRRVPASDVVWADQDEPARRGAAQAAGARLVDAGPGVGPIPGWALFRLDAATAARLARRSLDALPLLPARGRGGLLVAAEGLYTLASQGGVDVALDGGVVFDAARRPAGAVTVRLAPGRHELVSVARIPGAAIRVTGPDGLVVPTP